MSGGFQSTAVADTFSPAVPGDFIDGNPRVNINAGPGGIVAGAAGVQVARFCWLSQSYIDPDNAPQIANNFGQGPVSGFVANTFQGLNTVYLSNSSMFIPNGFMAQSIFTEGGFWVVNSGSTFASLNQVAYASLATGLVNFATGSSAASTVTAATSAVTAGVFSGFTGYLIGNQLTITAAGTGALYAGAILTAGGAATGTAIVAQLSGTPAGIGVYAVSIPEQNIAANSSWGGTYGILTLGATPSEQFPVGALLTGGTVGTPTYITAYISGNGSASGNTMALSDNTTSTSATLTATTTVATKWYAVSQGASGELVKMMSWPQG